MIKKSWQKKQNLRQNHEPLQCIFYLHILWTYNYIIYILHTHSLTHTNLESIYTIWDYQIGITLKIIIGISNTISRNKKESSKPNYKKWPGSNFLCNIIE